MNGDIPLKFGTAEVANAEMIADTQLLRLNVRDGVLNKHELEMLIKFLQAKLEQLNAR